MEEEDEMRMRWCVMGGIGGAYKRWDTNHQFSACLDGIWKVFWKWVLMRHTYYYSVDLAEEGNCGRKGIGSGVGTLSPSRNGFSSFYSLGNRGKACFQIILNEKG